MAVDPGGDTVTRRAVLVAQMKLGSIVIGQGADIRLLLELLNGIHGFGGRFFHIIEVLAMRCYHEERS